jgi:hypothetical protein
MNGKAMQKAMPKTRSKRQWCLGKPTCCSKGEGQAKGGHAGKGIVDAVREGGVGGFGGGCGGPIDDKNELVLPSRAKGMNTYVEELLPVEVVVLAGEVAVPVELPVLEGAGSVPVRVTPYKEEKER